MAEEPPAETDSAVALEIPSSAPDDAQDPQFAGRIAFVEHYDQQLASYLVRGVDVWLNNPEYPMEACGTSGMKAAINGVVNISVLDGWWPEAWDGDNGWGLTPYVELGAEARERLEPVAGHRQRQRQGPADAALAQAQELLNVEIARLGTVQLAQRASHRGPDIALDQDVGTGADGRQRADHDADDQAVDAHARGQQPGPGNDGKIVDDRRGGRQ